MIQAGSPFIYDATEANFEQEVLQRSHERPVVVDFWAPWCGPCRMLGPILEKLVAESKGDILLAKVDIDQCQELAYTYGIEAIPAVKAFRNGEPVLEFMGVLPEGQVRDFLDRLVPSAADRIAQQAKQKEITNPSEAEALYRQALQLDANHVTAGVGLARVLIGLGNEKEAAGLLERMGAGSQHAAEAERLTVLLDLRQLAHDLGNESDLRQRVQADPSAGQSRYELGCVLGAAGQYEEALQHLLAAAEQDRKLGAAKVREAMVKIFHVVGVRSDLADEYRDKLARVLY